MKLVRERESVCVCVCVCERDGINKKTCMIVSLVLFENQEYSKQKRIPPFLLSLITSIKCQVLLRCQIRASCIAPPDFSPTQAFRRRTASKYQHRSTPPALTTTTRAASKLL